MNLRDLEYLVAVADKGSFRAAATACGVSQPTLSVQVRKLEEELGVILIDRAATPPALTPVGQRVVAQARESLAGIQAIRTIAREATGAVTELRLGVFPTLGAYLLPHVLPHVQEHLPGLKILLTEEKSQLLVTMLHDGHLDAALVAMPVDDTQLHARPLFREEFVLATPVGHPLAGDGEAGFGDAHFIPSSDIADHELLVLDEGHCLGGQVQRWADEHGAALRRDYRATSLETLRHMIASGGGVTLLPALTVLPPVPPLTGVTLRRISPPAPSRDVALIWPHTSPRAETLEALASALIPGPLPKVEHPAGNSGSPLVQAL